jgi:hypothetical protein
LAVLGLFFFGLLLKNLQALKKILLTAGGIKRFFKFADILSYPISNGTIATYSGNIRAVGG